MEEMGPWAPTIINTLPYAPRPDGVGKLLAGCYGLWDTVDDRNPASPCIHIGALYFQNSCVFGI